MRPAQLASPEAYVFDPFAESLISDPWEAYHRLRAEQPVYWCRTMGAWVLTRMADIEQVLVDERFDAVRTAGILAEVGRRARRDYRPLIRFLDAALFFKTGEDHARDRRTLATIMNQVKLSALEPIAANLARGLAAPIRSGAPFDAVAGLADPFPQRMMARILGIPQEDVPQLGELLADLTLVFDPAALATYDRVNARTIEALALLERRIAESSDGSGLRRIYDEAEGDAAERLERAAATALFAYRVGAETTIGLIGGIVRLMATQPGLRDRLAAEPALIDRLVSEVLRLESNVQRVGRIALEDATVGDVAIDRGDRLLLLLGAANRDPARYPAPDTAQLDAKRPADVSFGKGKHFCIGAALARLEGRVVVQALLDLPPIEPAADPVWFRGRTIRRLTSLTIRSVR
ncbi:cytochrome P450 [Sphingomonas sanxanigenens]|uniref:Cytochrome P450 n=1 Tax=Sphingomonas sanxanigenens DSM 19645 = NX02 TaxID=1123269 RepID=W0A415_9SPHN|nr:cytochrome P450 [Sphingomonas sanxanigenens]AHE52699.1 hypothetical protein NX02_04790 [Sphingomonas sanxanigenens DSM 19645 = NX02]